MKLTDLAVLGLTGGLVYLTWKRHTEPQPIPAVKKLIKKATSHRGKASAKGRSGSRSERSSLVDDRSNGERVGTKNSDGSTARHVVGRGVRHG